MLVAVLLRRKLVLNTLGALITLKFFGKFLILLFLV